jgi:hypothetical protein
VIVVSAGHLLDPSFRPTRVRFLRGGHHVRAVAHRQFGRVSILRRCDECLHRGRRPRRQHFAQFVLAGNLRVKKAMAFLAADVFQTHARIDVPRRSEERLNLDLGQPAQCPVSRYYGANATGPNARSLPK